MIIWARCNLHPHASASDLCTRCRTAEDMNQRQAETLLAAGWSKQQVGESYGTWDWR